MNELIVLVDEDGREVGQAEKLATHNANTPLHRAFSCYVFNDKGEFLLTKRAAVKKVWPGVGPIVFAVILPRVRTQLQPFSAGLVMNSV